MQDCSICLCEIVTHERAMTECNHAFHIDCIQRWYNSHHDTCPNCRTRQININPTPNQYINNNIINTNYINYINNINNLMNINNNIGVIDNIENIEYIINNIDDYIDTSNIIQQ